MAEQKILVNLNLAKNQLLNAVIQNLPAAPSSPVDGQVYYNTSDNTYYGYANGSWLDLGDSGAGVANLGYTPSATDGVVTSSTGTDATIPAGSATNASLMLPGDKTKLDSVETSADVTDATNVNAAGAVMESDISSTPSGRIINDDTMATASETTLATSESIKAYVDNAVVGGMTYKGSYNANTNSPDLESGTGVLRGDTYTVTVAGTFFTEGVQVGDVIIAEADGASTLADYTIVNRNIPAIPSASESSQGLIELATQTEVDTGTDATRAVTPATLSGLLNTSASLDNVVTYTQVIGNNSNTVIGVIHNIGNQNVQSQVFSVTTGQQVICEVVNTSTTTTTFKFNVAPTTAEFRVVIQG
jgi:hypothetical protein